MASFDRGRTSSKEGTPVQKTLESRTVNILILKMKKGRAELSMLSYSLEM